MLLILVMVAPPASAITFDSGFDPQVSDFKFNLKFSAKYRDTEPNIGRNKIRSIRFMLPKSEIGAPAIFSCLPETYSDYGTVYMGDKTIRGRILCDRNSAMIIDLGGPYQPPIGSDWIIEGEVTAYQWKPAQIEGNKEWLIRNAESVPGSELSGTGKMSATFSGAVATNGCMYIPCDLIQGIVVGEGRGTLTATFNFKHTLSLSATTTPLTGPSGQSLQGKITMKAKNSYSPYDLHLTFSDKSTSGVIINFPQGAMKSITSNNFEYAYDIPFVMSGNTTPGTRSGLVNITANIY